MLSDKELSLVKNVEWILTKQVIIQKVYDLFAGNIVSMKSAISKNNFIPESIRLSIPKINKGENYKGLPYVILDYPRSFEKDHVFAVRTMFWWGNFFSITLHLSGKYKDIMKEQLCSNALFTDNFYICVNDDPWQHHFEEDNYITCKRLSSQERTSILEKNNFIKLAIKFELDQWNIMQDLLITGYEQIIALFNSPNGERALSPGIPITGFGLLSPFFRRNLLQ